MEISRQADYAIRAIIDLAELDEGELVQTREIARRQEIPEKYLPTIVRTLARAGLVRTLRGSHGGISLARHASQITVRNVVEAVDGPLLLNRCRIRPGECSREPKVGCALHNFWSELVEEIERGMDEVSFEDLVRVHIRLRND